MSGRRRGSFSLTGGSTGVRCALCVTVFGMVAVIYSSYTLLEGASNDLFDLRREVASIKLSTEQQQARLAQVDQQMMDAAVNLEVARLQGDDIAAGNSSTRDEDARQSIVSKEQPASRPGALSISDSRGEENAVGSVSSEKPRPVAPPPKEEVGVVKKSGAVKPWVHTSAPLILEDLKAWVEDDTIGVLVIACKRPQYLSRALDSILPQRGPLADRFPVVVSQDGNDAGVRSLLTGKYASQVYHMVHDQSALRGANGYQKLAVHYGWALGKMFDELGFQQVVILEEDMEISPDFYSYFAASLPVLRADKDLYCVSAWNDNGYRSLVKDPSAIYRTDCFPGLGWMLLRSLWDEELRARWPGGYWDEFMRRPDVRHGRQCLRPEINRSFTFGAQGESQGQYFETHLVNIMLNKEAVDFGQADLWSPVASVASFDAWLEASIRGAAPARLESVESVIGQRPGAVRLRYSQSTYGRYAQRFKLMPDEKEGFRRGSYRQVIPFTWRGVRVFMYDHWPSGLD